MTRTWEIADACGNAVSHTQIITVAPDLPPVITCPGDLIINLSPGECRTAVNWNDPLVVDDCTNPLAATQIGGPVSGSVFERNTTTTITYETAPDDCGHVSTCSFDVVIIEFQNPTTTIACNSTIQVSLDDNCFAVVGADMVLEGGPYGCYEDYTVSINGGGNIAVSYTHLTLPTICSV